MTARAPQKARRPQPGRRLRVAAVAVLTVGALTLAGCSSPAASTPSSPRSSSPGSSSPGSSSPRSSDGVSGTVTVFAAASLTKTFTELGERFDAAHPGAKVTFSFAGSSDLVSQLAAGAPADVFASADEANMSKAVDAGTVTGSPADFATNVLAIAVPRGNPAHVTGFSDLASPSVKTVVCAPQVPCGAATAKVEKAAGVTLKPVSEESSVTDVLGKVTSGEADAGIVYATDVEGAGAAVDSVPFPEAAKVVNVYPISVVAHAPNPAGGRAFVAFVTGPEGRKVLAAAGFGAP